LSPEKNKGLKKADPELFKNIAAILESTETSISIIPHENPDGDAIGAAIGLANILATRGNKVIIISPNGYPAYYNWFENKTDICFLILRRKRQNKILLPAISLSVSILMTLTGLAKWKTLWPVLKGLKY
jgi:hypothetical protein